MFKKVSLAIIVSFVLGWLLGYSGQPAFLSKVLDKIYGFAGFQIPERLGFLWLFTSFDLFSNGTIDLFFCDDE